MRRIRLYVLNLVILFFLLLKVENRPFVQQRLQALPQKLEEVLVVVGGRALEENEEEDEEAQPPPISRNFAFYNTKTSKCLTQIMPKLQLCTYRELHLTWNMSNLTKTSKSRLAPSKLSDFQSSIRLMRYTLVLKCLQLKNVIVLKL